MNIKLFTKSIERKNTQQEIDGISTSEQSSHFTV